MDYSSHDNDKKRKRRKSNGKRVKNKFFLIGFRIFIAVFFIGCFAIGGAAIGAYMGVIENAPAVEALSLKPSKYPSTIYLSDGSVSKQLRSEENREYIKLDEAPENLKNAFIAIEDERFYSHNGIDVRGILRALYTNLTTSDKQGASTITQQLIKNNVRKIGKNTLTTKIQEQYLAVEYEKKLGEKLGSKKAAKDYILELYLNSINMHYSLNGVQTASEYYFNKSASELTLSESAVIAAITQNPAKNAPIMNPKKNRQRQELILNKMLELKMITQAEYDEAYNDDVYARVSPKSKIAEVNNPLSYFNDALLKSVVEDLQEKYSIGKTEAFNLVYNGGFRIESTQDINMQNAIDNVFLDDNNFSKRDYEIEVQYSAAVRNSITEKTENIYKSGVVKKKEDIEPLVKKFKSEILGVNDTLVAEKYIPIPQPQANMVIIDYHNGHVKALTGGRGEKLTSLSLNRATDKQAARQPGSTFKILASFAPAIDMGTATAATLYNDAPYNLNGWEPKNWYKGYKGMSTVRQGITMSMNIVTVKNMMDAGIENCYKYLKNFGFTTLVDGEVINGNMHSDITASTALGGITKGVTQLELTAAYGTIANLGEYNKPILYTKVIDQEGQVVLENLPQPRTVLKKQAAYIVTDMMKDVITKGTGAKAKFTEINMPEAGKTGTASDVKDLTFVGYTPYYVAGVWIGFDKPKEIKENNGYHLLVWKKVMEQIHKGLPTKEFERPDGVIESSICGISGKLAVPGLCEHDPRGSAVRSDLFIAGTQTTEYCDLHQKATIDVTTGMKAGPYCPPESVVTKVGIYRADGNYKEDEKPYIIKEEWINGDSCTYHGSNGLTAPVPFPLEVSPTAPATQGPVESLHPDFGFLPGDENAYFTNTETQKPVSKPTVKPVPHYSEKPYVAPTNETPPAGIPLPDVPMIDAPSVDNFNY